MLLFSGTWPCYGLHDISLPDHFRFAVAEVKSLPGSSKTPEGSLKVKC